MKKPIFSKHKSRHDIYLPAQYIENKLQLVDVFRDRITLRTPLDKHESPLARVILKFWQTPTCSHYRIRFLESLSRLLL